MNRTLIRQAAASDAQSISRLQQQWCEEGGIHGFVPGSLEQITAAPSPYLLVAEANSEVIGFISGSIRRSEGMAVIPAGESYLAIDDLYISPGFRRHGVGSGLITQLLARAKHQGVAYALLYSAAKDIRSILRFYEHHGFQSWYVQMFREL